MEAVASSETRSTPGDAVPVEPARARRSGLCVVDLGRPAGQSDLDNLYLGIMNDAAAALTLLYNGGCW